LWAAVVIAVLAGPLWSMAGYRTVDVAWSLAGVSIILMLLRSTPSDAIRLPRLLSRLTVLAGMIWLLIAHNQTWLLFGALLGFAAGASGRRDAESFRGYGSAWFASAGAWHPMLWLVPGVQEWSLTPFPVRPALWVVALVLVMATRSCFDRRRSNGSWIQWLGWSAWLVAGAATVVLAIWAGSPP
jgi:hypothetical protein